MRMTPRFALVPQPDELAPYNIPPTDLRPTKTCYQLIILYVSKVFKIDTVAQSMPGEDDNPFPPCEDNFQLTRRMDTPSQILDLQRGSFAVDS